MTEHTEQETAVSLARAILDKWPDHLCGADRLARLVLAEAEAVCPHIVTSDEGTSYCDLAERQQIAPLPKPPGFDVV